MAKIKNSQQTSCLNSLGKEANGKVALESFDKEISGERASNGRNRNDDVDDAPVKLKRELNLTNAIGVCTGLVIGGGIYISPKGVLLRAKSPGLTFVLWAVGGVLSLFGALTYAEVGVMMPESGEKYAYLLKMFGPFIAFVYLWQYLLITRGCGNAIKCIMFGRYVLKPFYPDCDIPETAILLMATVLACFLTAINCLSVRVSARGQNVMTVISVLSLSLVIISSAVWCITGEYYENLESSFEGSSESFGDMAFGIHSTIYAYFGWTAMNFLVEELKNPARNLPLAIVAAVVMTTVLYVLVNVAYIAVLGVDGVLSSQAVAMSVVIKTLGPFSLVLPLTISITAAASFNSGMLVGSRLAFAGARNGHMPKVMTLINLKYFTPMTALIFQLVVVTFFIWAGELYTLINNVVFSLLVFDIITVAGFIRIRLKQKHANYGFKLPLFVPCGYLVIVTLLVILPLVTKPSECAVGLAIAVGSAIPYYVIVVLWKNKPRSYHNLVETILRYSQYIFFSVPESKDSNGVKSTKL